MKRIILSTLKTKIIEFIKDVVAWVVIIALLALTVFQYQTVQLLKQIIEDEEVQEIEHYEPEIDPCTLNVVECDTEPENTKEREAELLADYLRSKGGHELAEYASDIVELDRWHDVVAIAWKETQFCTTGVGASQNNCGGIKSWKTERTFKHYENVYDSLWDISYLLAKPKFKGMSTKELASTYCVNEAAGGGECPNWHSTVEAIKAEMATAIETKK